MSKKETKKFHKIFVTGVNGFIGDRVYDKLRNANHRPIDIRSSTEEFTDSIEEGDIVIHMGAYSSTTCNDPEIYKKLNTDYTKNLIDVCAAKKAKLIYASSAAVYGNGNGPLNDYGKSKLEIDEYAQNVGGCVGLRFFNVYGRGEYKKGKDASMISQWSNGYEDTLKLFNVRAARDFVYIEDVVDVILYFVDNFQPGIYDVGTGKAVSFEDVADELIKIKNLKGREYISFPKKLKGKYQFFTQADLTNLRNAGYTKEFLTIYEGLRLMN